MTTPSHMSTTVPDLPLVYDSTMLGDLMKCAYYFKTIRIDGWAGDDRNEKIDFAFGRFYASSVETYKKERLNGRTKEEATLAATRYALTATWRDGDPWGGVFERQWHCLGSEPYKNSKGNRAKCPYSYKGVWFPEPAPEICGECGSATEIEDHFLPDHPTKNRQTLLRAVCWWCDEQPQDTADGLSPISFEDGTPAVELFVSYPLPFTSKGGERYILTGHLDELSVFEGEHYVVDNKTTKQSLDGRFFSSYAPSVQFDTYDLLARWRFPELNVRGVLIDAIQLLKTAVRTQKWPYYKSDSQRDEHLATIEYWIGLAEGYALDSYWPMNKKSCTFCSMRVFCALPPEEREMAMKNAGLSRKPVWNPLEPR